MIFSSSNFSEFQGINDSFPSNGPWFVERHDSLHFYFHLFDPPVPFEHENLTSSLPILNHDNPFGYRTRTGRTFKLIIHKNFNCRPINQPQSSIPPPYHWKSYRKCSSNEWILQMQIRVKKSIKLQRFHTQSAERVSVVKVVAQNDFFLNYLLRNP